MRVEGEGRLEIVFAAFLTAHRLANFMHGANVEHVILLLLKQFVAKLADELKATIGSSQFQRFLKHKTGCAKTLMILIAEDFPVFHTYVDL